MLMDMGQSGNGKNVFVSIEGLDLFAAQLSVFSPDV